MEKICEVDLRRQPCNLELMKAANACNRRGNIKEQGCQAG